MKIASNAITAIASEGRIKLQVPDCYIGAPPKLIDAPDEWFHRIKSDRSPCVGKQEGYLYLSRAGWAANRELIREAFEAATDRRGKTWADFETHAEQHFAQVDAARQRLIDRLTNQLSEAQAFVV